MKGKKPKRESNQTQSRGKYNLIQVKQLALTFP